MKNQLLITVAIIFGTLSLFADKLIWKGADGGDWNTADNWTNTVGVTGVPTASDDVYINDVSSVVISGEAPLKSLTVGDGINLVISATGDGKLYLPKGDMGIWVTLGSTLDISATITGPGRLWRMSGNAGVRTNLPGNLRISGHNTFTGGVLIGAAGNAKETSFAYADSFGGPDENGVYGTVSLSANSPSKLILEQGDTTYNNPFYFSYDSPSFQFPDTIGTVRFKGAFIITSNLQWGNNNWKDSGKIYFDAPVIGRCSWANHISFFNNKAYTPEMHFCAGLNMLGDLTASDNPPDIGFWGAQCMKFYLYSGTTDSGLVITNSWGTFKSNVNTQYMTFMGENAAATNKKARIWLATQQIELNGYNQRTSRLTFGFTYDTWNTWRIKNSSDTPVTFTVTEGCNGDYIYGGGTSGKITFVYDASTGATLAITNGAHNLTGPLIVSNGTLSVYGTTFSKVEKVIAAKSGAKFKAENVSLPVLTRLDLGTGAEAELLGTTTLPENTVIDTEADSTLTLGSGVMITTDSATIRGTKLKAGKTYSGSSGIDGLEGAGSIYVPGVDIPDDPQTWNAGGGSSTRLDVAANWESGEVPELGKGGLIATFAKGTRATLAGDVAMRGAALVSEDGDFTIDGSGTLSLGKYGFTVTNGTQTVAVPVALTASQTWTVDGLDSVLALTGGLLAGEGWSFTKGGVGTLELSGDSSAYASTITCTAGTIRVIGENGIGPSTIIQLRPQNITTAGNVTRAGLALSNAVVTAALSIQAQDPSVDAQGRYGDRSQPAIHSLSGSTNRVAGTVSSTYQSAGNADLKVTVDRGSKIVFEGKVSAATGAWVSGYGECWFEGGLAGNGFLFGTGSPHVHIFGYSTGNASATSCYGGHPTLHYHAANALSTGMRFSYMTSGCMVTNEFHGYDQYINIIDGPPYNPSYHAENVLFTTDKPATLTLGYGSYTPESRCHYEGNLSLNAYLFADHTFQQESSATGTITCTQGNLSFGKDAVFHATTNLVVKTGAKIKVLYPTNLPRLRGGLKRTASIEGTGVLELGEGVELRVVSATVDGEELKTGVYGASSSAAPTEHQDDVHFAGAGTLVVGCRGMMVIVR